MKTSELKLAVFSDVHLGHGRTPTAHIIDQLKVAFPDNSETGLLDMIIIAGDLFDKMLSFGDLNAGMIQAWVLEFVRMCSARDIVLRVLEGTPLHDRSQSSMFKTFNEHGAFGCDLKYVDTLTVEHIDRFGLDVLYIPDEWKAEHDDVWIDTKKVLKEKQIDKVDIAVMHGLFSHQLPNNLKLKAHDTKRYTSIVRRYVFVGHNHKPLFRHRVLTPGSFDRLKHGEEEAKGHWRITLRENVSRDDIVFNENKDAWKYLTIDCSKLNFDAAVEKIATLCAGLNEGNVRVMAGRGDPLAAIAEWGKKTFGWLVWTTGLTDDVSPSDGLDMPVFKQDILTIHPTNIEQLVREELENQGVGKAKTERVIKKLSTLVNIEPMFDTTEPM